MADKDTTPPLTESARKLFEAAREVAGAWGGTFAALRRLLVADVALAGTALIRGLVLLFVAAILIGTAWALLTALSIWGLYHTGIGLALSLVIPMVVSAIVGAYFYRKASRALRFANLDTTRRQYAIWFGTKEEAREAKAAPPGELEPGAPPQPPPPRDPRAPDDPNDPVEPPDAADPAGAVLAAQSEPAPDPLLANRPTDPPPGSKP